MIACWGLAEELSPPPAGSVKDKGRIATIIEFLIYLTPIRKEKCSAIQCQSLICDCIVALIVLLTATVPFGSSTLTLDISHPN